MRLDSAPQWTCVETLTFKSCLSTWWWWWLLLLLLMMRLESSAGRVYQTLPCRGQNLLQEPQVGLLARSLHSQASTLPPAVSSTLPSSYGDYQNCTIVQSHRLSSSFGAHCTLAPKTLIFPTFVQVGTVALLYHMVRTSNLS